VLCSPTALPKERKRYNKKCTEIMKNLTKLVTQYNLLAEQYNSIPQPQQPLPLATVDAVKKQEFCWVSECEGEALAKWPMHLAAHVNVQLGAGDGLVQD
jgi:hypothetical protein